MSPITRVEKVCRVTAMMAIAAGLSSCQLFNAIPEEVFYFRYLMVEPDAARVTGTVYLVPNARNANCGQHPMRLEDIARAVQQIGGTAAYQQLYDCAEVYTTANSQPALFEIDFHSSGGVQVSVNRGTVTGVNTEPTTIGLVVNSGLVIDQPTNNGFATIDFGQGGDVFRCEAGNSPWHANITYDAIDTFFEFELDTRGADYAGGSFSCLARNDEPTANDKRLLIIMGGRFSMKTD